MKNNLKKIIMIIIAVMGLSGFLFSAWLVGFKMGVKNTTTIEQRACKKYLDFYKRILDNECRPLLEAERMRFAKEFDDWIGPYNAHVVRIQNQLDQCLAEKKHEEGEVTE